MQKYAAVAEKQAQRKHALIGSAANVLYLCPCAPVSCEHVVCAHARAELYEELLHATVPPTCEIFTCLAKGGAGAHPIENSEPADSDEIGARIEPSLCGVHTGFQKQDSQAKNIELCSCVLLLYFHAHWRDSRHWRTSAHQASCLCLTTSCLCPTS